MVSLVNFTRSRMTWEETLSEGLSIRLGKSVAVEGMVLIASTYVERPCPSLGSTIYWLCALECRVEKAS